MLDDVIEVINQIGKDDASPDTIESWDSLKHMNLIVALEEEFKTEFSDDNIIEMMNYKLIIEVIKNILRLM